MLLNIQLRVLVNPDIEDFYGKIQLNLSCLPFCKWPMLGNVLKTEMTSFDGLDYVWFNLHLSEACQELS